MAIPGTVPNSRLLAQSDRYGYGGRREDCPVCGAVTPDYCPLVVCEWSEEDQNKPLNDR